MGLMNIIEERKVLPIDNTHTCDSTFETQELIQNTKRFKKKNVFLLKLLKKYRKLEIYENFIVVLKYFS